MRPINKKKCHSAACTQNLHVYHLTPETDKILHNVVAYCQPPAPDLRPAVPDHLPHGTAARWHRTYGLRLQVLRTEHHRRDEPVERRRAAAHVPRHGERAVPGRRLLRNDISYKEYSWHLCKDTEGGANVERSGACCANTKTLAVDYQIAKALTAKVDLANTPYPASASFSVTETITGTKTVGGKDSALGPVTFAMQYSIDCPQLAWDHTKKENGGIWDIRECYSNDKGVAITGKITLSGAINKSILIALPGAGQDSGMVLKHGEFSNATL
ncbi:hypothetical protein JKP88DRAFT_255491 [Tribonema minus]|uniref:Uncharacterized protein n=1 Tax=Tribonema minus TaxID=303371 RepID=A0A835Z3D7_9STRA|nr:hypothetical protein JKP88DRAFT_255491 [Tribonema minus]